MLDHKTVVVKAGPGRFQMWVSYGTAQATELMSYPSQIWISVHSAATRICSGPIFWFSSADSVADKTTSGIPASLLPSGRSFARSGIPRKSRIGVAVRKRP
jgi:hypothetical protein